MESPEERATKLYDAKENVAKNLAALILDRWY